MKIPISEARRRLPALLKTVQKDPRTTIQITVRDEVVGEIRASQPHPEPGEAAKTLMKLRKKLARRGLASQYSDLSTHWKEELYGPNSAVK